MNLKIENVTFNFDNSAPILDNISIQLEEGKIYVIVGDNGSGKTTLFHLISGFLRPTSGYITYKDRDLTNLSPHKINKEGISRTFQNLRIIKKLTVMENILLSIKDNPTSTWYKALLPKSIYKNKAIEIKQKSENIIRDFFLEDIKNIRAEEISYGQQKLLSLACCIANDASLFLLDEPVAGLQPEYRKEIIKHIKILKQQNKTILIIEHDNDFIIDAADEIFLLNKGVLIKFYDIRKFTDYKENRII